MFAQVKIILIRTTHPGNIGAVARAMKNMGFKHLSLVSPKQFPSEEATARASGAEDILENAEVVGSLEEAIQDCHIIMGLSARARTLSWPTLSARDAAVDLVNTLRPISTRKAAIVLGQEQSGLSNEELQKCHKRINIPADPNFASLNVAQAAQVMTYELRMAILAQEALSVTESDGNCIEISKDMVTAAAMEGFYQQLEDILIRIQFLDQNAPGQLMEHLRRLYSRAALTQTELNILRGAINAAHKTVGLQDD